MLNIKRNFPIKGLPTFKIGGRAKFFCEARNFQEFLEAVAAAKNSGLPYKILAGGSNIVFPDGILNGFLIKIGSFSRPLIKVVGQRIEADSGVELMQLIKVAIRNGFSGLETLSGIPGTIGGAIVGNAGAYGHSISEAVEKVEIFDPFDAAPSFAPQSGTSAGRQGKRWLKNKDCGFHYRHSIFKEQPYIVLRAVLKFNLSGQEKGNPKKLKEISQNIITARLKKYKPGLRCPGSFFKNVLVKDVSRKTLSLINQEKIIEGKIPAGYLLEQVGAKGMRLGGIRIADFHGNLLINDGQATAKDVKNLAEILKNRVQNKFGIKLEEEIRYF